MEGALQGVYDTLHHQYAEAKRGGLTHGIDYEAWCNSEIVFRKVLEDLQ